MESSAHQFSGNVRRQLNNEPLQQALTRIPLKFVTKRSLAINAVGNFAELREAGAAIRQQTLDDLAHWLCQFETAAQARGVFVHWAEDAAQVQQIVRDIALSNGVQKVVKSKSMVSEECDLNTALEAAGITVVETDLGEYVLQLAKEPPSHIIAPIVHKHKEEVATLFEQHHPREREPGWADDIAGLCREAREVLRPHFLSADMGISGGNFLVAETGSVALVTNEGNGRFCTTLPRIHVAITGIEKVVPTLEDLSTLLRLLPRSATGQGISNYVSVLTGPKDAGASDGPEQMHVVLLDNGRSQLHSSTLAPILRCIRCGACMNHCPVYQAVGGHAYGWVYPGPMGSVWTPSLIGLEHSLDLPHASTGCNQCSVACPVKIPLPDLMRELRTRQVEQQLRPWREQLAYRLWGWLALHPRSYALTTRIASRVLRWLGGRQGQIRRLPLGQGWTQGRTFPAGQGRTFRELYRSRQQGPSS
ncbi:LutB/LldF family L-lactate oxidation iron-sulfur protein [Leeia aquatica]|uniref:Iron-sulfur cluster-binding protein n=1 Tax=Leeia aquatica TaxID=2725557 RepID=A0A847SAJ3_9NEIS|nr:LutB/LldF family L-lactate oxidation iron-sulfur protein [Leeia aquatica]NLR74556.1 iron-sulfur cluster-binding protein [Leeia aquatica]